MPAPRAKGRPIACPSERSASLARIPLDPSMLALVRLLARQAEAEAHERAADGRQQTD